MRITPGSEITKGVLSTNFNTTDNIIQRGADSDSAECVESCTALTNDIIDRYPVAIEWSALASEDVLKLKREILRFAVDLQRLFDLPGLPTTSCAGCGSNLSTRNSLDRDNSKSVLCANMCWPYVEDAAFESVQLSKNTIWPKVEGLNGRVLHSNADMGGELCPETRTHVKANSAREHEEVECPMQQEFLGFNKEYDSTSVLSAIYAKRGNREVRYPLNSILYHKKCYGILLHNDIYCKSDMAELLTIAARKCLAIWCADIIKELSTVQHAKCSKLERTAEPYIKSNNVNAINVPQCSAAGPTEILTKLACGELSDEHFDFLRLCFSVLSDIRYLVEITNPFRTGDVCNGDISVIRDPDECTVPRCHFDITEVRRVLYRVLLVKRPLVMLRYGDRIFHVCNEMEHAEENEMLFWREGKVDTADDFHHQYESRCPNIKCDVAVEEIHSCDLTPPRLLSEPSEYCTGSIGYDPKSKLHAEVRLVKQPSHKGKDDQYRIWLQFAVEYAQRKQINKRRKVRCVPDVDHTSFKSHTNDKRDKIMSVGPAADHNISEELLFQCRPATAKQMCSVLEVSFPEWGKLIDSNLRAHSPNDTDAGYQLCSVFIGKSKVKTLYQRYRKNTSCNCSAFERDETTLCCLRYWESFKQLLWRIGCRYRVMSGGQRHNSDGFQSALPKKVFDILRSSAGVETELFASTLNVELPNYCAAFPDIEQHFGCIGSALDSSSCHLLREGSYEVNPPFEEMLLARVAYFLTDALRQAETDNRSLTLCVVVPDWSTPCESHTDILLCTAKSYVVNVVWMSAWSHMFVGTASSTCTCTDGGSQNICATCLSENGCRASPCASMLVVLQSPIGRQQYPALCTADFRQRIQEAWKT
eukprot:Lankesteria_metandrocarpae@DN3949_c0_g1_i1.p1